MNSVYQHDLERLLGVAVLDAAFAKARQADAELEAKWNIVRRWRPESRYWTSMACREALELHDAVGNPAHGVLQWVRRHW